MRFYGTIGFSYEEETAPGIWRQISQDHQAYGDVLANTRRWQTDSDVNDDLNVTNRISVLANRFMFEHVGAMKYVLWNGTKWKIVSAELSRPRIIITLGGVYNG